MPIIRLLLLICLSTMLITACDLPTNTSNDSEMGVTENPAEASGNPCLEGWAINRMKEHIKERAEELITAKYNAGAINPSLLYSADISFDYISQPTTLENGDLSCSAKVIVSYVGNNDSTKDLAITYANLVNTNIDYNYNPFANIASGYSIKQELASMGINEFNINEFSDISGNKFATQMEYELRTTHTENGEEQQSYQAAIGRPAAMLATIALLDNFMQKNKSSEKLAGADNRKEQMAESDGYYEDEYVQHVEDAEEVVSFQDEAIVSSAQNRQVPVSVDQKAKDRSTTYSVKEKTKPSVPNETIDEDKYDTAYVYDYDPADVVIVDDPAY